MNQNYTLLFTEDDQETIEYVHDLLSPYFEKIYIGYDGLTGLEAYKKFKPDIVMTDINMPKMNGIEMVKKIYEIDPAVPVVFFTSSNDTSLLLEAINLGVDGFVVKPVNHISNLLMPLEKITRALDDHRETQRLRNILELQSRQASLGEIIANISHQWRQPLNTICLGIQEIFSSIDECDSNVEIDPYFREMLLQQIDKMSQMLDDVRRFFHPDNEAAETVYVYEVLEKIRSLYSSAFIYNQIKYFFTSDQNIKINVNQQNLIHAFINIVNNAKYALINNTEADSRYFFVSASVENDEAVLKFRDSGGGIDDKIIGCIFDPFFTSKHQNVGVGIGLYMTFQIIVHQNHGSIEAENVRFQYDGKELYGAQIVIRLPLH
jgi:signal transduction histidine kinase